MLSRAQEARVRDVLANHPPGTIQTYCLEHLAGASRIASPRHLREARVAANALGMDLQLHEVSRPDGLGSPPLPV